MIKLEKLPEPSVLQTNKAQWTQEFISAKLSNATNLEEIKHRYRHPEIKDRIVQETSGKCAYCESKIRHMSPGDIEHMKPKSDFADDIFEYDNLTLACVECNRRKNDNYDEDIGILNPYEVDPEDHLMAHGPLIFPKLGDDFGKLAFELFELNRMDLVERRKDELEHVHLLLDRYACEQNNLLKKLLKRNVEKAKDSSVEFTMVKRAFIKKAMMQHRQARGVQQSAAA